MHSRAGPRSPADRRRPCAPHTTLRHAPAPPDFPCRLPLVVAGARRRTVRVPYSSLSPHAAADRTTRPCYRRLGSNARATAGDRRMKLRARRVWTNVSHRTHQLLQPLRGYEPARQQYSRCSTQHAFSVVQLAVLLFPPALPHHSSVPGSECPPDVEVFALFVSSRVDRYRWHCNCSAVRRRPDDGGHAHRE